MYYPKKYKIFDFYQFSCHLKDVTNLFFFIFLWNIPLFCISIDE